MVSQFIFGSSAFLNALFNGGQLALSLGLAQKQSMQSSRALAKVAISPKSELKYPLYYFKFQRFRFYPVIPYGLFGN